jgi:cytochrome c-type protein NapC
MVAKIMAAKDVWYEITGSIDTPEKFEAHRWAMANHIWEKMRANDSRECRVCHSLASMDLENQSKSAARKHAKAEKAGKTCIDCHRGLVHKEPDPPAGTVLPEVPVDEGA